MGLGAVHSVTLKRAREKAFEARQEIADGRLYQPFDIEIDTEGAYWLAFPEARRNVPKIKAFRDWILGEIGGRS